MNNTEGVLNYVLLVMLIGLLLLCSIIALNLSVYLFNPQTQDQEVVFFIPTALFCNSVIIILLNGFIYVLNKLVTQNKERD
jgi:hypothetical protein